MQAAFDCHSFSNVATFRAGLKEVCGHYRVEQRAGGFAARAGQRRSGGLELASITLGPSVVKRDSRTIRHDDTHHFALILNQSGKALMSQGEKIVRLRKGDFFLSDTLQPSSFMFDADRSEKPFLLAATTTPPDQPSSS